MNPGELRNRIEVYRLPDPEETDKAGQPLDKPILHKSLWASIEPLRGRQIESARQYHPEITTRIKVRYRDDLDNNMFAVLGNVKFDFLYLLHEKYEKKELHIYVKEYKNV